MFKATLSYIAGLRAASDTQEILSWETKHKSRPRPYQPLPALAGPSPVSPPDLLAWQAQGSWFLPHPWCSCWRLFLRFPHNPTHFPRTPAKFPAP